MSREGERARAQRPTTCARRECGKTLPPAKVSGRPRLYCSPSCEELVRRERTIDRLAESRARRLTTERTQEFQAEMVKLRVERDAAIGARDGALATASSLVKHGKVAVVHLQGQLDELATLAKRDAASLPPQMSSLVNVLAEIITRWTADLVDLGGYLVSVDHHGQATGDPDRASHDPPPR